MTPIEPFYGAIFSFKKLAPLVRFERTTHGLGNRCSILLSYRGPLMPLVGDYIIGVVLRVGYRRSGYPLSPASSATAESITSITTAESITTTGSIATATVI